MHEKLGIATEAWSPLAQGRLLDHPTINGIADAYGKTDGAGDYSLAFADR